MAELTNTHDHPDSPVFAEGVPVPHQTNEERDKHPHCYFGGKQYGDGDCTVQNSFFAYSCSGGRWVFQGPAPCPPSR